MRHGCSPAAQTSRPSWTGSDTPRSPRPSSTLPDAGDRALAAYRKTRNGTPGDTPPPSA